MTPHLQEHVTPNHTWEDVYQGWESDEFQYYWKQHEFPVRAGDTSFGERGFAEALELARNGNEHARLHLRRVVRLARTPEQAQRALEALGEA